MFSGSYSCTTKNCADFLNLVKNGSINVGIAGVATTMMNQIVQRYSNVAIVVIVLGSG